MNFFIKIISKIEKYKYIFFLLIFISIIIIYKFYNPYKESFFPKCSFYVISGYKCAGCGSQRAIYNLLNFNVLSALKENFLLVIFTPYIIIGVIFDLLKKNVKITKLHSIFYGKVAIYICLIVIVLYWILRNIINI